MFDLSDRICDHLNRRRLDAGLWDDPSRVFRDLEAPVGGVSWRHTERVVEGLV